MRIGPAGRRLLATGLGAVLLAACSATTPEASPSPTPAATHDPRTTAVLAALGEELGVEFQSAGPHHLLGRAPNGVELDVLGNPVEQAILSVPAADPELGSAYLDHLRDLLRGPSRVYDWVASGLACRAASGPSCEQQFEQGNVLARFTDGGPDYVVVSITRNP